MSFQTFDSFQNQHPAPDAGANAAAAPAADTAMAGTDNAAQFQPGAQQDPSGSPGNQQQDGKTTLWYSSLP